MAATEPRERPPTAEHSDGWQRTPMPSRERMREDLEQLFDRLARLWFGSGSQDEARFLAEVIVADYLNKKRHRAPGAMTGLGLTSTPVLVVALIVIIALQILVGVEPLEISEGVRLARVLGALVGGS